MPKYWSFSFSISPSNEHPGLISFKMDWLDLLAVQGTLKSLLQHHSSKASILLHSAFFIVQLSHSYMTTGKTMALTRWTIVAYKYQSQSPNSSHLSLSPLISIHLFSLSVSLFHSSFYSSHAGLFSAPPSPPCSLSTHFKAFVHPAHLLGLLPSEIFAGLVLPGLISSTVSLDLLITQPQGLPLCISLFPTN